MRSEESYYTALISSLALKDEFAAILQKIDENAALGDFDCVWYTTNSKYMLVDEDYPVTSNRIVEEYTVDELYRIIIRVLHELGYDVDRKSNKLIISWDNRELTERLIRNA